MRWGGGAHYQHVSAHALGMGCFRRSMAAECPASADNSVVEFTSLFNTREIGTGKLPRCRRDLLFCCVTDKLLTG